MPSPADLARPLVETLAAEAQALARMDALVAAQLDAVRTRQTTRLDALAIETGDAAAEMHRLRIQRERQTRLLGRVLKLDGESVTLEAVADALVPFDMDVAGTVREARSQVRTLAARTRRNTDTLAFALQYAASIGRDVIRVLQGAGDPALLRTYTKGGRHTAGTPQTSYLNQMG